MKSVYSIPPPNRRAIGTKESMDQTISTTGNLERPQGVDALAHTRNNGAQQPDQHDHWTIPQPNPLQIQPHAQLRQSTTNPQCLGRVTNTDDDQESRRHHSSAQQGRQSEGTTPSTVSSPRTGLARCIPPKTPSSES